MCFTCVLLSSPGVCGQSESQILFEISRNAGQLALLIFLVAAFKGEVPEKQKNNDRVPYISYIAPKGTSLLAQNGDAETNPKGEKYGFVF